MRSFRGGFRVRPGMTGGGCGARRGIRGLLLWLCLVVGAVLVSPGAQAKVGVGDEPELSLKNLEGEEVHLQEVRGKVVLVDFWATWCAPCRESMPFYRELYEEKREEGFEILAVSVDEEEEQVRAFKERFRLPFPVLLDAGYQVAQVFGPPTMPTAYLIDRKGEVRERFQGFRASQKGKVREALEELLAEPGGLTRSEEEEGEQ